MTKNPYLLQRLTGIQQSLLAQHIGGRGLPNATIGNERETFLREFLQKVFPAHRRFSTGAITDSSGQLSGQVDVAVEYGNLPSFPMPATDDRLLLAESVAVAIEVKSDLVAQWGEVRETTKKIKMLKRRLNAVVFAGPGPSEAIPCIAVGYAGHRTIKGLMERLDSTPEEERPNGALVIDSGCYVGFGMTADGAYGLYALCLSINAVLAQLAFTSPDLTNYVKDEL